jgi:hypothetical protein
VTYKYAGIDTIRAAAEKAAAEKAEAQLTLKERRALLEKIRYDRAALTKIEAEIRGIESESRMAKLPPVKYGGPAGLQAAADEMERHERRKRQQAA